MAGPTSGILEIPVSLRNAVLEAESFARASKAMAANIEKDLAKVEVAQGKLASATGSYRRTLEDIVTTSNASAEAQKKSLDEVINKYKEYKAEISSAMARRASESDKERAAYDMMTRPRPAGPGAGYSGSLSGPVAQFIDIRQRHVSSAADAADRPHERAAYNAIDYGRVAPDEGAHVQERGVSGLRMMAEKADLKQREAFLTGLLDQEEKKLAATMKDRVDTMEKEGEYSKIASTAKTGAIATEAQWHVELIKTSQQIESNQKKMRELATSEVGSAKMREQAMNALAQQNIPLAARQKELNRQIENGTGGLKNNRQALQQLAFGLQDFISAGGMHNLAQGARGAANNLEMMAMSMGATLTPLKLMGLTLLPTVGLAAIEMAVGFGKSKDATDAAAESMKSYSGYVIKTRESIEELTASEAERERIIEEREAGKENAKVNLAVQRKTEEVRAHEHRMRNAFGVRAKTGEKDYGIADMIGQFGFDVMTDARNFGRRLGLPIDSRQDQLDQMVIGGKDGKPGLRGMQVEQQVGRQLHEQKMGIIQRRRGVKDEIERQQKGIEFREEAKHGIEASRNDAIEARRGRPLRKRDARDFDMQLKEADDEIKGLRDRLKRLEREARDKPNASLDELKQSIDANTAAHNRNAPAAAPARLPNLGFGPMDALRGMGWNL